MTASRNLAPVPEDDLDRLAREARSHHQQAEVGWQTAVEHAWHCGRVLLAARPLCPYGTWLPWLKDVGIPQRTAHRYMSLAERHPEVSPQANLTIEQALAPATKPTPTPRHPMEELWARWQRLVPYIGPLSWRPWGIESQGARWSAALAADPERRELRALALIREGEAELAALGKRLVDTTVFDERTDNPKPEGDG